MFVDLHMHTTYSDGEYEPLELVRLARNAWVSKMAIADHNTLEGSKIAVAQNPYREIKVIPAAEFTAHSISSINIHVLGINIDLNDPALNELTRAYTEDSKRRIKSLVDLLYSEYNITFTEKDVHELLSYKGNIGRPEVAKLCKKYGYVKSVPEAFDIYLNPVKARMAKKTVDPTAKELIRYITNAGGIACLAHPRSVKKPLDELKVYIKELMDSGLQAIEVYHSDCPRGYMIELRKIAEEFGLAMSVGSDYHGPVVTPKVQIRSGRDNNLNITSASILDLITEVKTYETR